MNADLYHLQINVSNAKKSLPFYKELLTFFGYRVIDESQEHVGMSNGTVDFWFVQTEAAHISRTYHRKTTGINHLSFKLPAKRDVDEFIKVFLKKHHLRSLYGTPKYFPEYHEKYYAVFFEDPDRIKIEVVSLKD